MLSDPATDADLSIVADRCFLCPAPPILVISMIVVRRAACRQPLAPLQAVGTALCAPWHVVQHVQVPALLSFHVAHCGDTAGVWMFSPQDDAVFYFPHQAGCGCRMQLWPAWWRCCPWWRPCSWAKWLCVLSCRLQVQDIMAPDLISLPPVAQIGDIIATLRDTPHQVTRHVTAAFAASPLSVTALNPDELHATAPSHKPRELYRCPLAASIQKRFSLCSRTRCRRRGRTNWPAA